MPIEAPPRQMEGNNLAQQIMAIQRDPALTDAEKAKKRQELLSGKWAQPPAQGTAEGSKAAAAPQAQPAMFDDSLKCTMCMDLCARPVTAPCQHNFCLACLKKWVAQGKKTCPTCRHSFPAKFAANPRINTALTTAIRMAKLGVQNPNNNSHFERVRNKDRPDEAFTTDRAVRAGRANAASGRIMVTVPNDHFGPIPPEADPRGQDVYTAYNRARQLLTSAPWFWLLKRAEKKLLQGVKVGESWKDRLDCRQWGAHFPHVAGIAGQSGVGAQSVVLSGGYEDDRDEGEWFLYTGSGGRDLSGNKRTNKEQSFDQKFESSNKALLISCQKGLPLRVVRSHKEKRSAYAPTEEEPVRYDGIYRIARCWRKAGMQKFLVCRYLFVRCDNEPAPWSTEDVGDTAWSAELPKDAMKDMKEAQGTIYETADQPWWDWNAEKKEWGWARPPPVSQKSGGEPDTPKKLRKKATEQERALREFMCKLCSGALNEPVSAPCGHHFCRPCLEKHFQGQGDTVNRGARAGRTLRVQKVVKPCPTCKVDIADFLANCQVNRDMQVVIEKLQAGAQKAQAVACKLEAPQSSSHSEKALAEEVENAEAMAEDGLASAGKASRPAPMPTADTTGEEQAVAGTSGSSIPALELHAQARSISKPEDDDLDQLCKEFPAYDRGLVGAMLADQGGDVAEVHACLRRMAKQTAAAQKRTEAEARKAARLVSAAASSEAGPTSSQAVGAGSHASQGTAKEVEPASGNSLALAGTSAAAAVAPAGQSADGSKHTAADSSQKYDLAIATAGSDRPQLTVGSSGNASKSTAAGASTGQDENQASNAAAGGTGQLMTSSSGQAGSGKVRPGKKRAAEAPVTGDGPRGGHSCSTRSKTGA